MGSAGRDTILGSGAVPGDYSGSGLIPIEINAHGGSDRLSGGNESPDALNGGAGVDTVTYGAADRGVAGAIDGQIYENNTVTGLDTLTGIESLVGSPLIDTLSGSAGSDRLKGGRGADVLHGLAGKDLIVGGRGRDEMFGDKGIDVLFATDGKRDLRIDCGLGANRKEVAKTDPKDPKPNSC
ncbi:MAG: hypothetical protein EXQ70_06880 [Solirubrobacterales bacterium]|nr:hypothetical protein [Solirubrobacterales bacterium]